MTARIAIVGAGWSGLASAIRLTQHGIRPAILDAAPQAGGRARRVELTLAGRAVSLDNGQHLLVGAYRATLDLMRTVGLDPDALLLRQPFTLAYPDGFELRAPAWPAPWHLAGALLRARGLPWSVRLAVIHAIRTWQARGWTTPDELTASDLLAGHPGEAVERLWEPLCLAALNVRLADASARVFLAVLRDSLGKDRESSDLLIPRADLSALLPDAAVEWLAQRGAELRFGCLVEGLRPADGAGTPEPARPAPQATSPRPADQGTGTSASPAGTGRFEVRLRAGAAETFDAVILALPPWRAAVLLDGAERPELRAAQAALASVESAPIATVYLAYPDPPRLPAPMLALRDAPAAGRPGQWVFDRGALNDAERGIVSVVISGAGPHLDLALPELAAQVARQISQDLGWPAPLDARAMVERRATIVPAPGLDRPPVRPMHALYVAADSADGDYPSTLEGSVRSGLAAADALLRDFPAAARPSAG